MRVQVVQSGSGQLDPCNYFSYGGTKDFSIFVNRSNVTICDGDFDEPVGGNPGNCTNPSLAQGSCIQQCNLGYVLTNGSLTRVCDESGFYAPTTAICSYGEYYCYPGPTSTNGSNLGTTQVTGNTRNIADFTDCPGGIGVQDRTSQSADLAVSWSYCVTYNITSCGDQPSAVRSQAWIDYNQNLIFESQESLGTRSSPGWSSVCFSVPTTAIAGNTTLRAGDRKSGSAGMPRPISYAVFCLKKKKQCEKWSMD
eukprot:TRINITY_DN13005_c0_g1_i11.p1 TRINITY_DN13005_c0_g1~~TRINITY_DN13005_c0_g1_i11.p1  ORF type:complete len:253 (+),score=23.14 TRINITY_DN13005_c0_g1_i11:24-782(+)